MSLDVYLESEPYMQADELYEANITHNLVRMAQEAGIYEAVWRPEEAGITKAKQLIDPLIKAIAIMQKDPDRFKALNPPNGWGTYDGLLVFLQQYLSACQNNPDANVKAYR